MKVDEGKKTEDASERNEGGSGSRTFGKMRHEMIASGAFSSHQYGTFHWKFLQNKHDKPSNKTSFLTEKNELFPQRQKRNSGKLSSLLLHAFHPEQIN